MAKLYFKFGAMGSSKTAQALMTKFNYEEKNNTVWLIKPSVDTRDNVINEHGLLETLIKSRIGLSAKADVILPEDNIEAIITEIVPESPVDVIIADESQFFTKEHIIQLRNIVSNYDIPVLCFGLRTDFQGHLFEGSKALFEVADSISEIKSICSCGNKAIINARIGANGNIITEGETVLLGGNEHYTGMCWKCWNNKKGG